MFELFKLNFHYQIIKNKNEKNLSFYDCRTDWKFDAEQMLRNKSAPSSKTYFSFCEGIKRCPVELLIICLKTQIDPHRLVTFINKTFNTNYINH